MTAERAGRRAGRVEQDRVELAAPASISARRLRPARLPDACARDFRAVVPDDFPTRRARSPGGPPPPAASSCRRAPRRGRARRFASAGIRRAGSEAARSWTHHRPSPKPASAATDALVESHMIRRERFAVVRVGIGLRLRIVGEAQVERRPLRDLAPRGLRRPSSPQAARQRSSTSAGSRGASIGGTPRRSSVPSTPCTSRRGRRRPAASAVATSACSGVPSPTFCASARRSTIRALLSSGRRWRVALSISASRSGRRRSASPAIATASA